MRFEVKNLGFYYEKGKWIFRGINITVESGQRVGLVGPSGYGKSTLSRLMGGYLRPVEGEILMDGKPLPEKGYCPVQLIYQHPEKSVDPFWPMRRILNECWEPPEELLEEIGIEKDWLSRRPHELSGGELQRFCIARALGPQTKLLLADEVSTMLDAVTQAQIWQLLLTQAQKRNLGLMIITHNEALARRVCTDIIDLTKLDRRWA